MTISLSKLGFLLVNVWLVFHLFCIVAGPISIYPSSELQQRSSVVAVPYLQLLYMNHGWKYFSPQPGGANLLSFDMTFPNGEQQTLRFPTNEIEPRLLYHRYFMMSEFLGNGPPEAEAIWARSFARKLCLQNGAQDVVVTKIFHDLPSRIEFLAGRSLDDRSLFHEDVVGEFHRHQFVEERL
jgi:hypothetical protein